MKKLFFIIPFMIFSCAKKEMVSENSNDNKEVHTQGDTQYPANSIVNEKTDLHKEKQKDSTGISRTTEGDKIIIAINGNAIPVTFSDEFSDGYEQLIIKIRNFEQKNISGKITPENPQMNIRFNQIKLPDGSYDGPFGRELMYKSTEKGEVWLMIGKSNMASGDTKGKFSVTIQ